MNYKTKPFDINAALGGSPVVTRSGQEVRILAYDESLRYPVVGTIVGSGVATTWTKGGLFSTEPALNDEDLFMKVALSRAYANLHSNGTYVAYITEDIAKRIADGYGNHNFKGIAVPIDLEIEQ